MSYPWHFWNENVFKLTTFLNNLPENSKVVFSSSAAVYKPSQTKLTEESSCEPTNVYGVTKLAAENVLKHFSESKISAVCLRYFNAAGGELDGSAAENHSPETHFIPRLCLHYMGRISDFKIYGTDYPTKDGTCIRDFVHILDLAAGHLKAIEYLSSNSGFRVINLGSGIGYSLYDVIEEFEGLVGKKVSIEIGPRRHGDPPFLVADISKAKQLLNWQPRFSLRDMLKSQLTWLESKI
jgi:UDP-glucose-4-epimerase GalE